MTWCYILAILWRRTGLHWIFWIFKLINLDIVVMTNCQNQKWLPHEPQNFLALLQKTGAFREFFPFKSRTLTTQCAFWKQAFVKKDCCSNKKFCECLSYSCNEYQRLQACLLETGLFPSEVQSHSHKNYLFQWHFICIVNARLSKPKLYFCWNYSNIVKFCTNLVSILFWKSNKMISNWEMWKHCFFGGIPLSVY